MFLQISDKNGRPVWINTDQIISIEHVEESTQPTIFCVDGKMHTVSDGDDMKALNDFLASQD